MYNYSRYSSHWKTITEVKTTICLLTWVNTTCSVAVSGIWPKGDHTSHMGVADNIPPMFLLALLYKSDIILNSPLWVSQSLYGHFTTLFIYPTGHCPILQFSNSILLIPATRQHYVHPTMTMIFINILQVKKSYVGYLWSCKCYYIPNIGCSRELVSWCIRLF